MSPFLVWADNQSDGKLKGEEDDHKIIEKLDDEDDPRKLHFSQSVLQMFPRWKLKYTQALENSAGLDSYFKVLPLSAMFAFVFPAFSTHILYVWTFVLKFGLQNNVHS